MKSVTILMATFNGSAFLEDQLNSIQQQDYKNWKLIISDDGSSDNTIDIINEFITKNTNCSVIVLKGPQKGFACNFLNMLRYVETDYACFCDQDDIWMHDKLSYSISQLSSKMCPSVYTARTSLIDETGKLIGKSQEFNKPTTFRNALVQSIAGGNTMMLNAAAIKLINSVFSVDDYPVSHDWWIYILISGSGGEIVYDKCPKVFYRQHKGNLIGSNNSFAARAYRIKLLLSGHYKLWNDINSGLLLKCSHFLTSENKKILNDFISARQTTLFKRIYLMKKIGLYRQTWLGGLTLKLSIFLNKI